MSEINNVLGVHGAGYTLESGGRTWHFTPLTQRAKGEIEAWLEARAWAAVARARPFLSPEEYLALLDRTGERIAAGEYAITSKRYERAMATEDGQLFFLKLLLRPRHPDVTDEDIRSLIHTDAPKLEALLRTMFPNVQPPEPPAPGA